MLTRGSAALRYKDDESRTSQKLYLDRDQQLSPWATSMLIQVSTIWNGRSCLICIELVPVAVPILTGCFGPRVLPDSEDVVAALDLWVSCYDIFLHFVLALVRISTMHIANASLCSCTL